MLENHGNTLKIWLFGQSTEHNKATLSFENLENATNFEDWGLTLVACKKKLYG